MAKEHSSGVKFEAGDHIKGYEILKAFDPGGFAFAGKARAPNGRVVFFKKYKRPGGSSPWLGGFVSYQTELKQRIQGNPAAKALCYEFIEFFEMSRTGAAVPLRVFYQVFEWVEGGGDLRKMLDEAKSNPAKYAWIQKVNFARMMMAGVNAIHKGGVIHTDLKPENLYLIPDASVTAKYKLRIIDMDFSLLEGKQAPWHGFEGYTGTPGYMSPEHAPGRIPLKASDVFTCGLMLGELLGGAHPAAPSLDTYEEQISTGRLKRINVQETIEGVPDIDFLNSVINACLRPEFNKRPTAEQVLNALNGRLSEWDGKRPVSAVTGLPPLSPKPSPRPTPPPPPPPPKPSPTPTPPSPKAIQRIELTGPKGEKIVAALDTTYGRGLLKSWGGDYEMFFSPEQFRLFKDPAGRWMIEHSSAAKNSTNLNGAPLSGPAVVQSGMTVSLGKTGKCPIKLNLI